MKSIIAKSGYKAMPERVQSFPPRQMQTDPCSHTLEITENGTRKSIRYMDGDVPKALSELVKDIAAVIDRYPWEQDASP